MLTNVPRPNEPLFIKMSTFTCKSSQSHFGRKVQVDLPRMSITAVQVQVLQNEELTIPLIASSGYYRDYLTFFDVFKIRYVKEAVLPF